MNKVLKSKSYKDGYSMTNEFRYSLKEKKDYETKNKQLLYLYKKQNNINAKDELILTNINLVRKLAKLYSDRSSMDYEDLVQEGIIGLMKGIEKFDIKRDVAFSTYAYYWIRQSIDRAICINGYLIRIPVHLIQYINRLRRLEREEMAANGFISLGRICSKLNISQDMYYELKQYVANYQKYTSLNQFIDSEDSQDEILDFVTCENDIYYKKNNENYDLDNTLYKKLLEEDVYGTLATLLPREEKILRMRYGLDDGEFKSLEEIGKRFNLTRERIRQIEARAFRKMKHYSRAQKLKAYCI